MSVYLDRSLLIVEISVEAAVFEPAALPLSLSSSPLVAVSYTHLTLPTTPYV